MSPAIRVVFGTVFLGLAGFLVIMAAQAYEVASERTVTYKYLSDALIDPLATRSNVTWIPAERTLAREFTPGDENKLGIAISEAWQAHATAMHTGETFLLSDHFSGIALARAQQSAAQAKTDNTQMVVLEQTSSPSFYHMDGSIFQSEGDNLTARFAIGDNDLTAFDISRDHVVTTLMNETTGWRVFSHERKGRTVLPARKVMAGNARLAGINYYPADFPWRDFWPKFDHRIVEKDFGMIKWLGANSVRFFLPVDDFTPGSDTTQRINELNTFLDLAKRAGLKVVPTLFDLKHDYSPGKWVSDVDYLASVLPILAQSGVVAFIDIKNEPDLDTANHGKALVHAWLKTMLAVARDKAPDLAYTIGWSSADAAQSLVDEVDLVTYHDYAPLEQAAQRLADLAASTSKPVMVTEIGTSSWSVAAGLPSSESKQADALSARLDALSRADGLFIWTLHDFADPDRTVVGSSPLVLGLQSAFGLYDRIGSAKPSAQIVRRNFADFLTQVD